MILRICPQQVLIGIGDGMVGLPGCDLSPFSSASIAATLLPNDAVRVVKKKLITAAVWEDDTPDDFGLFDDCSEKPLEDSALVPSTVALNRPVTPGRIVEKRAQNLAAGVIRLPRPYLLVLWAARLG